MNLMNLMQLKESWAVFKNNHPKFPLFLKAALERLFRLIMPHSFGTSNLSSDTWHGIFLLYLPKYGIVNE